MVRLVQHYSPAHHQEDFQVQVGLPEEGFHLILVVQVALVALEEGMVAFPDVGMGIQVGL